VGKDRPRPGDQERGALNSASWPDLFRPSTSSILKHQDVDARHKAGMTTMTQESPNQPRAFFGRRKGHKLRANRARLLETLLPRLALDLSRAAPADLATLFPVPVDDVALEIGFGGGESMIAQAQAHPRTGFIGVEPFVNGMARALAVIEENKLCGFTSMMQRL